MTFALYVAVSVIALATDWLCLIVLTQYQILAPGFAAALAYVIGGVVNYSLSRRFVFFSVTTRSRQLREVILFAATCALGTAVTGMIVWWLTPSITPFPAKLVAMAMTFVLNYWCRRLVVFDSSASARNAAGALRP